MWMKLRRCLMTLSAGVFCLGAGSCEEVPDPFTQLGQGIEQGVRDVVGAIIEAFFDPFINLDL